MTSLDYCLV